MAGRNMDWSGLPAITVRAAPHRAQAAANAKMRARDDLARALNEAIEPMHCPACGIFQPEMVRLRKWYGKQYDPNKYASDRSTTYANAENTIEFYNQFMETWPYDLLRYSAK
jgi:hypothetical protein